eukprot:IDg21576t1
MISQNGGDYAGFWQSVSQLWLRYLNERLHRGIVRVYRPPGVSNEDGTMAVFACRTRAIVRRRWL